MVYSKEQVYNATINTFKQTFESIEGTIDNTLKSGKRTIQTRDIISALKSIHNDDWVMKDQFLEYVMNKYKLVGWSVKREQGYDQKDNCGWDYLIFS